MFLIIRRVTGISFFHFSPLITNHDHSWIQQLVLFLLNIPSCLYGCRFKRLKAPDFRQSLDDSHVYQAIRLTLLFFYPVELMSNLTVLGTALQYSLWLNERPFHLFGNYSNIFNA